MAIMIIGKAGKITPTTLSKFINMKKEGLMTLIDSLEKLSDPTILMTGEK